MEKMAQEKHQFLKQSTYALVPSLLKAATYNP
jgi:hypothetical protein